MSAPCCYGQDLDLEGAGPSAPPTPRGTMLISRGYKGLHLQVLNGHQNLSKNSFIPRSLPQSPLSNRNESCKILLFKSYWLGSPPRSFAHAKTFRSPSPWTCC